MERQRHNGEVLFQKQLFSLVSVGGGDNMPSTEIIVIGRLDVEVIFHNCLTRVVAN